MEASEPMYTQVSPNDLNLNVVTAGMVPQERTFGFRDILPFLISSWWIIALSIIFFVGGAFLYIAYTPPSYVARAQLITGMYGEQPRDQISNRPDDALIEGQIEVIKSDDVLRSTIRALSLLNDPELASQSPTIVSIIRSWLATASPADLQALLSFNPELAETSVAEQERFVIAVLRGRLWVRRVGRSSVLDIAFNSSDPEKAATIANTIAESYLERDIQSKSIAATQASDWLSGRLTELREKVFAADQAVERFKVQGDSSQTAGGQFKLSELQSVADTYRKVYESFLERWAETSQQISYPVSDARFVTRATAPLTKTEPKSTIIIAFAALLGIAAGTSIASIRRAVNRRISSPSDLAKGTDVPCLGGISLANIAPAKHQEKSSPIPLVAVRLTECFQPKTKGGRQRSRAAIHRDFRNLKATLAGLCHQKKINVIGVVGIHRAAGTTTVAANLAFLHSAAGSRTLLIDTCVSNPTISRYFAAEGTRSLAELLNDPVPYSSLRTIGRDHLTVLPTGRFEGGVSPGDRLASPNSTLSLSELKKWFDIAIVDLPSLNDSSDARALAPLVDTIVVVARAGVTTLDALQEGINALQSVGGRVSGVVLNAVSDKRMRSSQGRMQ
jgi:succinoglycan biosynthesis transport protein ExoP